MSPHALMLRKTDGTLKEAACTDAGEIKISGSIEAPSGGATEDKQDTQITSLTGIQAAVESLDAKTPDGSAGAMPVDVQAALPAGTNLVGGVECRSSGGTATFATASAPSNASALPTSTSLYSILMGRESNSGNRYYVEVDTSRRAWVVSHHPTPGTVSHSSALEEQRGIDFGFALRDLTVFADADGYILLVNKASDAVNADVPMGAHIYKIAAGETIVIGVGAPAISFSSGVQAVFSTTAASVTLAGVAHARFSIRGS